MPVEEDAEPETDLPMMNLSPRRERWVVAGAILASSMAFIDTSVVNVALPVLQRGLGATFAEAQWVIEAYTLPLSALILAGGAVGDIYGRRRMFALGILLFALASAACGLAPDPLTLIGARAVQGVAGALMMPGSLSILAACIPPERRGHAIGMWSAATGITVAIAPAFGGWMIDALSWRGVFLVNLPIAAVALAIVWTKVPESRGRRGGRLDLLGTFFGTLGLACLTFGLIDAGTAGFRDPLASGMILFGVLAMLVFLVVEARTIHPMVPLGLFRERAFAGIQAFTFLLWAALQGALFFVPFRLMQVHGFSPLEAGAALLPFVIVASVLSRWAGSQADRMGPCLPLVAGALVSSIGLFLLILPGPSTPYWLGFLPALLVLGLGMGICVAPVTVVALNAAGNEHVGIASAVNNTVARMGGLIAIALFGIMLADRFDLTLDAAVSRLALPPAAIEALAPERAKLAAAAVPPDLPAGQADAVAGAIKSAFVDGYRWTMGLAGLLAALSALVAALSLGRKKR
jgi:EmrB/QacA subfamily drug resistance transporter